MASRTNSVDNKMDEIQEELQEFATLWSSLRAKYAGTNITKTIARLLHMYQPEEGIHAYERLLKTVIVLLEDFDVNGLRLLVSMVPPPKNSTEETVKDVFFKATGFIRLDAPMFHQNQSLIPAIVNPSDDDVKKDAGRENMNKTALINHSGDITTVNVDKTLTNCYQTPQTIPQEFYAQRGYTSTETDYVINQNSQKINYYSGNSGQRIFEPRNVHQGYKMNWMPTPFMVQNGNPALSNSYGDFLVKTEDNKFLRVPMANVGVLMSCNSQNMQNYHPYQLIPTNRPSYPYEKNDTTTVTLPAAPQNPPDDEKNSPPEKNKSEEENVKCTDEINDNSLLENLTVSKNLETSIDRFLTRVKNNVDLNTKRINTGLKKAEVSPTEKEFFHPRDTISSQNDANDWMKNFYMKNADIAAYKRQYYDSVLNFQRAKAVTNSLIPMPSTSTYDPSYYEYLQQQQWIYQHQQRLMMGHQYPQRLVKTEFPTLRNPYSRSNEWISHCTTSRHSQEGYGMNSGFYTPNFHPDYEPMTQSNNSQFSKVQTDPRKWASTKLESKVKENGK